MTENALVKKMKLKPGQRAAVIGARPTATRLRMLNSRPSGRRLARPEDGASTG